MKKNKQENSLENSLDEIVDKTDPTLSDLSYEPDIFSHSFKWTTKVFRDKKTNALVIPSLPYSMPQINGGVVLGVYYPSAHSFEIDVTKEDYKHTYKHEQGHAKGGDEYLAESYASGNYQVSV